MKGGICLVSIQEIRVPKISSIIIHSFINLHLASPQKLSMCGHFEVCLRLSHKDYLQIVSTPSFRLGHLSVHPVQAIHTVRRLR